MNISNTLKEFRDFAIKGNVLDMAIGVIIGGAFGKIVTSMVNDIIMPIVSMFTGGVDIASLFITLDGKHYETLDAAVKAQAAVVKYGSFCSQILDFVIIAFTIFMALKFIIRRKKAEDTPVPAPAPTTQCCDFCKTDIHIDATRCPNCTSQLNG